MKKWLWVLILSTLLTLPVAVIAGDVGNSQSAGQKIEEMVVTAGRIKEYKEDVTTNISVYGIEDLEKLSITDLSDLLVKEGVMVREYPNSTISVGIRGFRTETHGNDLASHVLILIDGRRSGTGNLKAA